MTAEPIPLTHAQVHKALLLVQKKHGRWGLSKITFSLTFQGDGDTVVVGHNLASPREIMILLDFETPNWEGGLYVIVAHDKFGRRIGSLSLYVSHMPIPPDIGLLGAYAAFQEINIAALNPLRYV